MNKLMGGRESFSQQQDANLLATIRMVVNSGRSQQWMLRISPHKIFIIKRKN